MREDIGRYVTHIVGLVAVMLIGFIVAFFLWLIIATMTEFSVDLIWFLIAVIVAVSMVLLNWLSNLSELRPKHQLPRFRNTPVAGAEALKVTYGAGKVKKVFRSTTKAVISDGKQDAFDNSKDVNKPIVLLNGRVIGAARLKSIIFKMGQLDDTTRKTWVGGHHLARTEWQGILSFLDANEVLECVDGNGTAKLNKFLTSDENWEEYVNIMVDNWVD
jgi:hypothetical protein